MKIVSMIWPIKIKMTVCDFKIAVLTVKRQNFYFSSNNRIICHTSGIHCFLLLSSCFNNHTRRTAMVSHRSTFQGESFSSHCGTQTPHQSVRERPAAAAGRASFRGDLHCRFRRSFSQRPWRLRGRHPDLFERLFRDALSGALTIISVNRGRTLV